MSSDCNWGDCTAEPTHWGKYCDEHAAEFTGELEYSPQSGGGSLW